MGTGTAVQDSTLRVFFDCPGYSPGCDFDFLRTEIQSTRRQLTLQYGVTPLYADYTDTTIYNKTSETTVRHSLTAALSVTQPWGSANVSLTGSHLLQDFKQNPPCCSAA